MACTPKVVSEMLGHSSVAVTLDLYSHATETLQRAAADKVGAALAGMLDANGQSGRR